MSYSITQDTMTAVHLTRSTAHPQAVQARKEPLIFPRKSRILATLPAEPEDARITGGTRSLTRRLLALNLPSLGRVPVSVVPASQQKEPRIA